ncbi:epidermal growth factor-like protein 7 isoform 2-T2 [Acridotheres tristis]
MAQPPPRCHHGRVPLHAAVPHPSCAGNSWRCLARRIHPPAGGFGSGSTEQVWSRGFTCTTRPGCLEKCSVPGEPSHPRQGLGSLIPSQPEQIPPAAISWSFTLVPWAELQKVLLTCTVGRLSPWLLWQGSPLKAEPCTRSQHSPRKSRTCRRDGPCGAWAASPGDSSSSSAPPARRALPGQAAGFVPWGSRAAGVPTPSPTCSPCTSPTSPPARATASAAPTGPSTGLPTGRGTGRCLSPRPRAVLAGAEQMATHWAVTELSAGSRARTEGAAPSPGDAPAPPAGRGEPARQMWTSVPARATGAASSASTQPGASTVPARTASASLPMTRAANPWCHCLGQTPPAKQVPPVK